MTRAYSNLKKQIYSTERELFVKQGSLQSIEEAQPLVSEDAHQDFIHSLDLELEKIIHFYRDQESRLALEMRNLNLALASSSTLENDGVNNVSKLPLARTTSVPPSSVTHDQPSHPRTTSSEPNVVIASQFLSRRQKAEFVKQATELYVVLFNLKEYVSLNHTGYEKILKKYEKVTGNLLKSEYLNKVDSSYPFLDSSKNSLDQVMAHLIEIYALVGTKDNDLNLAKQKLQAHVHERVVFYRNTIWKDMVEFERKNLSIGLKPSVTTFASEATTWTSVSLGPLSIPLPKVLASAQLWLLILGILLFIGILLGKPLEYPEQNNCLAILVFVSFLWAFEVLPLFVTALLVPFFVVLLRVLKETEVDDKGVSHEVRLDSKRAAKKIFSDMFGPVIMILLGGFAIAAALSKQNIAKSLAGAILGRAGTKPIWVILANMFVSTFSSMLISNVAAPVLCFSLIMPLLRNLPAKSNYAKALVMGIAMSANVGGMASPISSPQNVIAMGVINPPPSWFEWFAISIPVCIVLDLLIWALLLAIYQPSLGSAVPEIASHTHIDKFNAKQYYVLGITFLTIALWCIESSIESVVGDMGVIAILPIVAFFGFGILTKDDWNSMLWSVVVLAMGGICLGKAVQSSGLLDALTSHISPYLSTLSPFYCLVLFSWIVLVVTSFISHTVGALIILPVIAQVGAALPDPHPRTLVMAVGLMCSGAMGLPVSSFPNMNAISLDGPTGVPWLSVLDFLKVGLLSSFVAWIVILFIGYPIMIILDMH